MTISPKKERNKEEITRIKNITQTGPLYPKRKSPMSPPLHLFIRVFALLLLCWITAQQTPILSRTVAPANSSAPPPFTFVFTPYAELMPGSRDGKVQVTVTATAPVLLKGFLQLWRKRNEADLTSVVYDFNASQAFLTPAVMPQTVVFHRLVAGTYIAAYFDTGGTREGGGTPEISQAFHIPRLYSEVVQHSIALHPSMASGLTSRK